MTESWKSALVGGLFTATLQTGLGVQPVLGMLTRADDTFPPGEFLVTISCDQRSSKV